MVIVSAVEPLLLATSNTGALGAFGATLSMVTLRAAEAAPVLPATSVALAVSVCAPRASAELVMLQAPVIAAAVAVPSTVTPSVS